MSIKTKILLSIIAFAFVGSLFIQWGQYKKKLTGDIGFPIYSQQTPKSVLCGTSSTALSPVQTSRQYESITNLSSVTVYLGLNATATMYSGIAIPTGTTWKSDTTFLYAGAINCVASTTASTSVQEVI